MFWFFSSTQQCAHKASNCSSTRLSCDYIRFAGGQMFRKEWYNTTDRLVWWRIGNPGKETRFSGLTLILLLTPLFRKSCAFFAWKGIYWWVFFRCPKFIYILRGLPRQKKCSLIKKTPRQKLNLEFNIWRHGNQILIRAIKLHKTIQRLLLNENVKYL